MRGLPRPLASRSGPADRGRTTAMARAGLALLLLVLPFRGCGTHVAATQRPSFTVGAVEDAAQFGNPQQQMQLAAASGMHAIDLSAVWKHGETAPEPQKLSELQAATQAAHANG